MRAGNLKHSIIIERYILTKNDFGESIEKWSTLFSTRAEIKPFTGREYFASSMKISEMTHKITFRYSLEVKTSDRILFNGKVFDITSIANIRETNRVIEILATEQN